MIELTFTTHLAEETIAAGRTIAATLTPGVSLILRGDLGAGKTTLVKGIAEAFGVADAEEVTSPTFTLVHQYEGTLNGEAVMLYHLDLYRLETERELGTLGLEEMISEPGALVLVEWGEKFQSVIDAATAEVSIENLGGDERLMVIRVR